MNSRWTTSLLMLLVAVIVLSAQSQEAKLPKVVKRITDFTNTLSANELSALEGDLARFEDSTSTQIVVIIIPTIGGENLEDFSLRTAELNGIGRRGKDNGALFLIVKDDRKMRIEVGYGLEGAIPDGVAGQIIRREVSPYFRSGEFYAGIKAGIDALMLASRHEYKAEPKKSSDLPPLLFFLILLFVIFMIIKSSHRKTMGVRRAGGLPIFYGGGSPLPRSHSGWGSGSGGGGGFGGFSGGGGSFGGGGASGGW